MNGLGLPLQMLAMAHSLMQLSNPLKCHCLSCQPLGHACIVYKTCIQHTRCKHTHKWISQMAVRLNIQHGCGQPAMTGVAWVEGQRSAWLR